MVSQTLECLFLNYLCLGHLELARATLLELHSSDPKSATTLLERVIEDKDSVIGRKVGLPSATLVWFCLTELRKFADKDEPIVSEVEAEVDLLIEELKKQLEENAELNQNVQREVLAAVNELGSQRKSGARKSGLEVSGRALDYLAKHFPREFYHILHSKRLHNENARLSEADGVDPEAEAFLRAYEELVAEGKVSEACRLLRWLGQHLGTAAEDRDLVGRLYASISVSEDDTETAKDFQREFQQEVAASGNTRLLQSFEAVLDKRIKDDTERPANPVSGVQLPPSLQILHKDLSRLEAEGDGNADERRKVIHTAAQRLHQEARMQGWLALDIALQAAVSAVEQKDTDLAMHVLELFPKLRPLVAALGWDLLQGQVAAQKGHMEKMLGAQGQSAEPPKVAMVEGLCQELTYKLKLADVISKAVSGGGAPDQFSQNLVLERLAVHSPLRVIMDMLPPGSPDSPLTLLSERPSTGVSGGDQARHHDLELLHMHFAFQAALKSIQTCQGGLLGEALSALAEAEDHLRAVNTPWRQVWLIDVLISLIQMDPPQPTPKTPPGTLLFLKKFTTALARQVPSLEAARGNNRVPGGRAWTDRCAVVRAILGDWQWRVGFMEKLAEGWQFGKAVGVLKAPPKALLNMCIQEGAYALGKEVVQHHRIPEDEAVSLEVAEWVEGAVAKASVEGTRPSLDFSKLSSRLSDEMRVLLCLDMAMTTAPSASLCNRLLSQAKSILQRSEGSGKVASLEGKAESALEDTHELGAVLGPIIERLQHLQAQEPTVPLRELLSGGVASSHPNSSAADEVLEHMPHQKPKAKAIATLQQTIRDAEDGKRQFLSGKLHNLVKALAEDDDVSTRPTWKADPDGSASEISVGLRGIVSPAVELKESDESKREAGAAEKEALAYLSGFIQYVASIGDIVEDLDTTHTFNFFSLLSEHPSDLLTRLVFERRNADAASKAAALMSADLVHQVVSACVPPVFAPGHKHQQGPKTTSPRYPLQLDVVRHLARSSLLRAVLACFFRAQHDKEEEEIVPERNQGPSDQLMDFALEHSKRFPVLHRWVQLQARIQEAMKTGVTAADVSTGPAPSLVDLHLERPKFKRLRDSSKEGSSSQTPDVKVAVPVGKSTASSLGEEDRHYLEQVRRLTSTGKLQEALALCEHELPDGPPDDLLQLLMDPPKATPGSAGSSWKYCMRIKNKELAAHLALRHMPKWELQPALEVLDMCAHHLPATSALRTEVCEKKERLERYRSIMQADKSFATWQDVAALHDSDPEGLTLRLASQGAVDVAIGIAQACKLPLSLRQELQSRRLLKVLQSSPTSGGGSTAGLRFLQNLPSDESALQVALGALPQLTTIPPKQLLVREFLVRRRSEVPPEDLKELEKLSLGLSVLSCLPLPWQQRCSSLAGQPELILETLLMAKQLKTSKELLMTCSALRDDSLITRYLVKALALPPEVPPPAPPEKKPPLPGVAPPEQQSKAKRSSGELLSSIRRSSWSGPAQNFWQAARHTFLGSSDASSSSTLTTPARQRLPPSLPPNQSAAWEAMAGGDSSLVSSQRPRVPGVMIDGILTGDVSKDDVIRHAHRFEGAPDASLAKAILDLYSTPKEAASCALEVCRSQANRALSRRCLPEGAGYGAVARGLRFTNVCLDALRFAQSQGGQLAGPLSGDVSALLVQLEVVQALLSEQVPVAMDNLSEEASAAGLRDKLVGAERYELALLVCDKLKVSAEPVYKAWGQALLRMGEYPKARSKLREAWLLDEGKASEIALQAVQVLEDLPPSDIKSTRALYTHTARTVVLSSEEALSFDSYLNVLNVPEVAATWSRRSSDDSQGGDTGHLAEDQHSFLDDSRLQEAVFYLKQYAPHELLPFLFRHGHFSEAFEKFLSALPPPSTPPPTPPPGKPSDLLSTDLGTVDEMCELAVAYGAVPVLRKVVKRRVEEEPVVMQMLLQRICSYCQTHRHFNHLYAFQMLLKDHIAAGLTCIQLFLNSATQEEALKHLFRAKEHFDEGLAARQAEMAAGVPIRRPKDGRKTASAKLSEEELIRYSTRLALQMDVVGVFSDSEGPPWKHSIFGNPTDTETQKRRLQVAEVLVERSFDLAFRVIYDFGLPAVDIYAGAAQSLARRKKTSGLAELLKNIKGTIEEDERDQVLLAAIGIYANEHKEHPSFLIEQLSNSHKKVLASVASGKLKSAFQYASRANNMADVQLVAHQAREMGQLTVMDMCHHYIAKQQRH